MLFSVRKIIKRLTENETPGFLVRKSPDWSDCLANNSCLLKLISGMLLLSCEETRLLKIYFQWCLTIAPNSKAWYGELFCVYFWTSLRQAIFE